MSKLIGEGTFLEPGELVEPTSNHRTCSYASKVGALLIHT